VGNVLSLKGVVTAVPIELDSSGQCEVEQMRVGPLRSQWRGSKIHEENKIPWFNRNSYRAL
jgi:hypothetical protein